MMTEKEKPEAIVDDDLDSVQGANGGSGGGKATVPNISFVKYVDSVQSDVTAEDGPKIRLHRKE